MTTYSDDFSGETVSSPPSNWTARFDTTNQTLTIVNPSDGEAEDDRAIRLVHTAAGIRLISFDSMDADANRQDSEIVIRFRFVTDNLTASDLTLQLWLRASGSSGSEDGYEAYLDASGGVSWRWAIRRWDAGTASGNLDAFQVFRNPYRILNGTRGFSSDDDPEVGVWYYARFRVNSTTLQFRQWAEGSPEPTTWDLEATDSDLNVDGWTGFGIRNDDEIEVDYVGAGTNGDTAPINISTNTVVRGSAAYAQVLNQEANPGFRVSAVYAQALVKQGIPPETIRIAVITV